MNYAVLIAVIIGITNMIPFFGPFIGAIPSVLILLMSQPIQALIFIIYVIVMQQIDGNIINPRIIGHNIGMSPFWVIFAIIIMSGLFGAAGIFVGVPLFSVLYTLISHYISNRLKKRSLPEATEDYYAPDIPLNMAMPEKKDGNISETSDKR
jgi:predicted PurR-regulated permease PerM